VFWHTAGDISGKQEMTKQRPFEYRFGVGDPDGKHSLVWKVWASRNTPDVYITAPSMGGMMKASIHASGQRHIGLTSEYTQDKSTRHFDRWLGGYKHKEGGPSLEFQVRIPTGELRSFPLREREKKNVVWLPPAPESQAMAVMLLFVPPDLSLTPDEGWPRLICAGTLADSRQVCLWGMIVPDKPLNNQAELLQDYRKKLESTGIVPSSLDDSVRLVVGTNYGGVRGWTEMALSSIDGQCR
jgi:hypothetical protein